MTYATLMVHLDLGRSNAQLLRFTGELARRFDAHVIGIVAAQPMQIIGGEGFVYGDFMDQDSARIDQEIAAAQAEFRGAFAARADRIEWRSTVMMGVLADYVSREARSADLFITGVPSGDFFDSPRRVSSGDLVMQLGRPVLVVPASIEVTKLDRVMLAWKDTREARRAAYDALPMLKAASHVTVVEIAAAESLENARLHLEAMVVWLKRHAVSAEYRLELSDGDDAARLNAIATEDRADVVVAGAYGHSRLREWALGGVTRDLMFAANRCAFVSH